MSIVALILAAATLPVGYLLTVGIVVVGTAFAVAGPRARRTQRWSFAYLFSMTVNELPLHAIGWLGVATALGAVDGSLEHPAGVVAAGVAVGSAVGLVVLARRATTARGALARALDRDLGEARAPTGPMAGTARMPARHDWWRLVFAPVALRAYGVRGRPNIRYGPHGRGNRLDVYLRPDVPGPRPVLVHLHGGGFRIGGKSREARALLLHFARRGWVCISANYRLQHRASYRETLLDVQRVIAWARNHGAGLGADETRIVLAGSSAGGHLAAMAALTADEASPGPAAAGTGTEIAAVIALYAYFGPVDGSLDAGSTPHAHLRPDAPPFFVVHGDRDTIVRVEGARAFVHALRAVSANPVVYAELPGAQHGFDLFRSIRFDAVVDAVQCFVDRTGVEAPAGPSVGAPSSR